MTYPTLDYELELWSSGYQYVVGIDEVGRGAWASPVVVGAVVFSPQTQVPDGVNDSKLLAPRVRENLSSQIKNTALSFSLGVVEVSFINRYGIGKATHAAMRQAIRNLNPKPDFHLIDAFYIKNLKKSNQKPIIKGDQKSCSIAAASIIAKVARDQMMVDLSTKFPEYYFDSHKGYGTKRHQEAIRKNGFCNIHRASFNLGWITNND